MPPDERVVWTIAKMSRKVKNVFVGLCRMHNQKVPDVLEYLILKHIREIRKEG